MKFKQLSKGFKLESLRPFPMRITSSVSCSGQYIYSRMHIHFNMCVCVCVCVCVCEGEGIERLREFKLYLICSSINLSKISCASEDISHIHGNYSQKMNFFFISWSSDVRNSLCRTRNVLSHNKKSFNNKWYKGIFSQKTI